LSPKNEDKEVIIGVEEKSKLGKENRIEFRIGKIGNIDLD
jgi:hypothetical protein